MSSVPENQQVEKILKTYFNQEFAKIAEDLCPTLHRYDRSPKRLVKFEKDDSVYFGMKPENDKLIDELPALLWGRNDEFILDFGVHLVGFISFRIDAKGVNIDAPCRLRLTFGESPYDVTESMAGVNTWISTSWLPDEVINVDFMPDLVALPRRYSFRFLRVQIIDTSPKYQVQFSQFKCEAVSSISPDTEIEQFQCGDSLLQAIDEISIFTLRDCMQTVFEDGPRRDRRLWIGDLRLQALTSYHTFNDFSLAKRCLFLFAAIVREDSSLPACLFEKPTLTPATDYILDYDALFGATVYDYVAASGDVDTGTHLWPTVQGSLLRALAHLNPETSIFEVDRGSGWKFLDWDQDLDHTAGMHGLVLYCLRAADKLALLIGKPQAYTEIIEKMTNAAAHFVSYLPGSSPQDRHPVFTSGPDNQISLASAAWLTLAEAFPVSLSKAALLAAFAHPETRYPHTPYLTHHIAHALIGVRLYDEAITLLKSYWGGMVEAGADTFWECFDFDPQFKIESDIQFSTANRIASGTRRGTRRDPRRSPYGDVRNNSFCHAWSCTPSYLLRGTELREYLGASKIGEAGKVSLAGLEEKYIDIKIK